MLSKQTTDILEQHDITLHNREEQDGQFYREIEFYSDAGENVIETIWYDGTNEGFCRAFDKNADDFDPGDHAEMYVNLRGQRGVPDSIRTLIEDADGIEEFDELNAALTGQYNSTASSVREKHIITSEEMHRLCYAKPLATGQSRYYLTLTQLYIIAAYFKNKRITNNNTILLVK